MFSFQFKQQRYFFHFKKNAFIFCLFVFILFCTLGYWQWQRYSYKKALIQSYEQAMHAVPKPWQSNLNPSQFQHLYVTGHYKNDLTILIQNQFYQSQLGFEVLTPFQIGNEKKLLLIDRGWMPVLPNSKPQIEKVMTEQKITGHIKWLNEKSFILGKNILEPNAFPLIVQRIDFAELEKITQHPFYPYILRLDPSEPYAYIREWVITTVLPERHLAYAIQWFLFAAIILIIYFFYCCERDKREGVDVVKK